MKVPFVFGQNDLRLSDVAVPGAGPRDVVLKVGVIGICGSDLGYIVQGGLTGPTAEPFPLGHELAGTVIAVGAEVTSVALDDRVVVNPLLNMIGNGGREGGFADRLLIRDVTGKPGSLLKLPDGVSLEVGALVEPLAVAAHAIKRLGASAGDKVAIFGAGPIGLAVTALLRRSGIEQVVVFDLSAFRRARAEQLGAQATFDPRETAPEAALKAVHGTVPVFRSEAPATSHFVEASGAPVLADIVDFARTGATICVVANQKKPVPINAQRLMTKELTLCGAFGYPTEFGDIIDMLAAGDLNVDAMISHRFEGAEVMAAFETATQQDRAAKVLVHYDN